MMEREAEAQIIDTGIHTCTCHPPTCMWQPTSIHKLIGVNMNHQDISILCGCVVDCTRVTFRTLIQIACILASGQNKGS